MKPKILFWDIETTPNIVTAFDLDVKHGIHFQNIIQERTIICISWKWLGKNTIRTVSIDPKNPTKDKKLLEEIRATLEEADGIVAHYGDGFDSKFVNARLIFNNLKPLPNIIQIDTWKLARSKFLFNSNKLDYLAQFLGIGTKIRTNYALWRRCMDGDKKALAEMVRYNKHDVRLLEKVYLKLAPFVQQKLKSFLSDKKCSSCGKNNLIQRGKQRRKSGWVKRAVCNNCGHWNETKIEKDKK